MATKIKMENKKQYCKVSVISFKIAGNKAFTSI